MKHCAIVNDGGGLLHRILWDLCDFQDIFNALKHVNYSAGSVGLVRTALLPETDRKGLVIRGPKGASGLPTAVCRLLHCLLRPPQA